MYVFHLSSFLSGHPRRFGQVPSSAPARHNARATTAATESRGRSRRGCGRGRGGRSRRRSWSRLRRYVALRRRIPNCCFGGRLRRGRHPCSSHANVSKQQDVSMHSDPAVAAHIIVVRPSLRVLILYPLPHRRGRRRRGRSGLGRCSGRGCGRLCLGFLLCGRLLPA